MGSCSLQSSASPPSVGNVVMEKSRSLNKTSGWKVYSRRKQFFSNGSIKADEGKITTEGIVGDDCHGLEDLQLELNQSTDDSSSDSSQSDMEALECFDVETENERHKGEEAGLEGLRFLLGAQVILDNDHMLSDGQRSERKEDLGVSGQGLNMDVSRLELKIGKKDAPWNQINEAAHALNLELIENQMVLKEREVQQKPCRSLLRRKGGERELHNLKCSIDFDKGRQAQGTVIDK